MIVIDKQLLYDEDTLALKMLHSEDGTLPTNTFKSFTLQPVDNLDVPQGPVEACFLAKQAKVVGEASRIHYRFLVWDGDSVESAHWIGTNWFELPGTNYLNYLDYFDLEGSTNGDAPHLDMTRPLGLGFEGSRLHNAVRRDGFIWTCQDIGLDGPDGDYDDGTVDRTGIQWLKVQVTNLVELQLVDFGRIFDAAESTPRYYYYPSIGVNSSGSSVVGYTGSSAAEFIGAYYSVHPVGGPMSSPLRFREGQCYWLSVIWADYSGACADPADDAVAWIVQPWVTANERWETAIMPVNLAP